MDLETLISNVVRYKTDNILMDAVHTYFKHTVSLANGIEVSFPPEWWATDELFQETKHGRQTNSSLV